VGFKGDGLLRHQDRAGADLVAEYVQAARDEGMRVGFYYSLMDWHHPDGARCLYDEEARKRFIEYTHGLVRELCTNYGTVDIMWYDVSWPLDAAVGSRSSSTRWCASCSRTSSSMTVADARGLRHPRATHHRREAGATGKRA